MQNDDDKNYDPANFDAKKIIIAVVLVAMMIAGYVFQEKNTFDKICYFSKKENAFFWYDLDNDRRHYISKCLPGQTVVNME